MAASRNTYVAARRFRRQGATRCYISERRHLQIVFGGIFERSHDVLGGCSRGFRSVGLSEVLPAMCRTPSQRTQQSDVYAHVPGFVRLKMQVT